METGRPLELTDGHYYFLLYSFSGWLTYILKAIHDTPAAALTGELLHHAGILTIEA